MEAHGWGAQVLGTERALPMCGDWDNLYCDQKEKMNCSLGAQSPILLGSAWLTLLVFKEKVSSVG